MRLCYCLEELLGERNKHGVIQEIHRFTGVERHKIARILRNETRTVDLDIIEPICEYLVKVVGIDPARLPGDLFARAPMGFWEQLVHHPIQTYIGRRGGLGGDPENYMVNESDLHVNQVLVKAISRLKAAGQNVGVVASYDHGTSDRNSNHQEQLVRAQQDGRRLYADFRKNGERSALVSIGSVKSNPISAIILGRCFGADPFEPEDDVEEPGDRKCPIFLSYRPEDSQVPSCAGGRRLALSTESRPGIYYERKGNDWEFCPRTDTDDAAVVFYVYDHQTQTLELVLGGFSADATGRLGEYLDGSEEGRDEFLWPPLTIENQCYGLFVVRFNGDSTMVERVPDEALKRRILERNAEPA